MKKAKLKFKWPIVNKKKTKLLDELALSQEDAEHLIEQSYTVAAIMIFLAKAEMKKFEDLSKEEVIKTWSRDVLLVEWFGKVEKRKEVKEVIKRTNSIYKIIFKNKLKVRIRSSKDTASAMNYGAFLSKNTITLFPKWFSKSLEDRAAIIIHEFIHLSQPDQKLDGQRVYGSSLARRLAIEKPKKARKSAENYEWYCLELYQIKK